MYNFNKGRFDTLSIIVLIEKYEAAVLSESNGKRTVCRNGIILITEVTHRFRIQKSPQRIFDGNPWIPHENLMQGVRPLAIEIIKTSTEGCSSCDAEKRCVKNLISPSHNFSQ